jgi:hypothetical protein
MARVGRKSALEKNPHAGNENQAGHPILELLCERQRNGSAHRVADQHNATS